MEAAARRLDLDFRGGSKRRRRDSPLAPQRDTELTSGPWSATLAQSFSAGYIDANVNASNRERRVGAYETWDVQLDYRGFTNLKIAAGIFNLFDRAPPFSNQTSLGQFMYDPRYADPRGRTFYARLTLAFG